jgi:hypothetical protein
MNKPLITIPNQFETKLTARLDVPENLKTIKRVVNEHFERIYPIEIAIGVLFIAIVVLCFAFSSNTSGNAIYIVNIVDALAILFALILILVRPRSIIYKFDHAEMTMFIIIVAILVNGIGFYLRVRAISDGFNAAPGTSPRINLVSNWFGIVISGLFIILEALHFYYIWGLRNFIEVLEMFVGLKPIG